MGSLNHIAAHVAKNDEATGGDASAAFIDRSTRKQTVAARFLWTVKLKLTWSAGRMQQRERASDRELERHGVEREELRSASDREN